ncbi:MAG: gliding motility lipoprotein GldH [Prevotella sp.]|jgi:gliding motility-associated lipoprotein GldH|nr:gliding motility lipoprotein GldH [Prevotella sp.]
MTKVRVLCWLLLALPTCFSCRHSEVYYQFDKIKDGEWTKNDTLYFHIDSSLVAPQTPYDISIEVSHNAGYPYCNIWFYVQDNLRQPRFSSYSQQYVLADPFGKWYGAGFGALYQLSLPYKDSVCFVGRRDFCIKIVHGMRDEPLKGIEKIGVRVTKRTH